MSTRQTNRRAYGALTLLVGGLAGGLALGTAGGASAQPADLERGAASMSSPYIPDVPHVPADVTLVLGPDGSADGARFVGPGGSVFNGPVDQVGQRVHAWWAQQMAAGTTSGAADQLLTRLTW